MIDIIFDCYSWKDKQGEITLFLFWPDGEWDENKYTLEEALSIYPLNEYNWIKVVE